MQKSGVPHAEKFLKSPNISLVIVRAVVPAGVSTKDRFDIEIELPQASATSSLANGFLMQTRLAERAMTKEGDKDDKVIALGGGPVMIGSAPSPATPRSAGSSAAAGPCNDTPLRSRSRRAAGAARPRS